MIDDKEIDIATRVQVLSKHVNETAYFQLRSIEDFKDGAKWAINEFLKDLWHDIFEEHIPREKRVIVEYTSKGGIYYRSLKIPDDIQWVRGFSNEKTLRRWLYVDDLFPKEGGENEKE